MSYYKRVEIEDMEGGRNLPEFAFTLDEEATARLAAADALFIASKDAAKFVAKYVADSESVIGKRALDRLKKAIREYREAT